MSRHDCERWIDEGRDCQRCREKLRTVEGRVAALTDAQIAKIVFDSVEFAEPRDTDPIAFRAALLVELQRTEGKI